MTVTFINPQGRTNKVNIKREDLPKLQALEGYTITKFECDDAEPVRTSYKLDLIHVPV